ncbi:hypothetical protein [Neobacillus cucumis]|uniref:Uncharacterized protein n=1 Tax=Neobacillus cucumis TaxID=1740721 RepID=A0A2N5HEQ6_9BACI|nr:hypothetical protein [Neobacillus cucumis]PLS04016.1 hypothetical protein CVD27_12715 [Neobacillus cucumis]
MAKFQKICHQLDTDKCIRLHYDNIKLLDVITMTKIPVIFEGKDYIMLHQYSSGYCEITEEGASYKEIKLVHFSELIIKQLI